MTDDEDEPVAAELTDVLDLHTFAPRDAKALVGDYLDEAVARGWTQVRIIHGKGVGVLRTITHAVLDRHPAVESYRLADGGSGGWGATIVILRLCLLLLALAACGSKREPAPARLDAAPARAAIVVADARPAPDAGGVIADATAVAAVEVRPSARCRGLPSAAEVDVLPAHGDVQTFHVHVGDDQRWLVFDGPKACHVTPVGRAEGRARGAFWPGRGELKAFVLSGEPCELDEDEHLIGCVVVVAVREDSGAMLDAIETCQASMEPAVHAASIFADQDSLIVSCPDLTGFGMDSRLQLVHVVDGKLKVVLTTDGAWGDHGPSDECTDCKSYCWTELDEARWRVIERGAAPVLETRAPLAYPHATGGEEEQAKHTAALAAAKNLVRWRFDPAQGEFVAERRRHADTSATEDQCAPFPPRSPLH